MIRTADGEVLAMVDDVDTSTLTADSFVLV